jgi:dienelactone hydrolase
MPTAESAVPGSGPRVRNFSPWAQWQLQLASVQQADPFPDDVSELDAWRARVRGRLTEMLGAAPASVPLDVEIVVTVDCGSYRRESIVFDVEPTMSVPAYLLVPHARVRPGPAVLAIHGHGPGKDEVCGVDTPAVREAFAEHHGDYAHSLAELGYVVLAPDLRCFGARADWQPDGRYHCDVNLVHAMITGANPLAQNLFDLQRALDALVDHPLVDGERLGVVGFSYGATMALFLAAIDERARATVVSGYLSSWQAAHRVPWNLCGSQVLTGMLGSLEHVDVAALVAPRPLLVETGTEDVLFPEAVARATVGQLRAVYEHVDATDDALEHDVFVGEHRWHGEYVPAFLERWLNPDAGAGT